MVDDIIQITRNRIARSRAVCGTERVTMRPQETQLEIVRYVHGKIRVNSAVHFSKEHEDLGSFASSTSPEIPSSKLRDSVVPTGRKLTSVYLFAIKNHKSERERSRKYSWMGYAKRAFDIIFIAVFYE